MTLFWYSKDMLTQIVAIDLKGTAYQIAVLACLESKYKDQVHR